MVQRRGVSVSATLCAIGRNGVQCYGKDGSLGGGRAIVSVYEDRQGNLWAVAKNGIWRWRPGPPKFYPLPIGPVYGSGNGYIEGIAEDETGKLLIGMKGGILVVLRRKNRAISVAT